MSKEIDSAVRTPSKFNTRITHKRGKYDPSIICSFLYDLSKRFSHWYHDNQILKAETPEL